MIKQITILLNNKFIFIGIIVTCVLIMLSSISAVPALAMETKEVRDTADALEKEIKATTELVSQLEDPEKQAQIAREQYHLSESGELIFEFPE